LWERIEVRGITLIPTFSLDGRRGSYQAKLGCGIEKPIECQTHLRYALTGIFLRATVRSETE
jgi:hypothetical protein